MPHQDGDLEIYNYGEEGGPVGIGNEEQDFLTIVQTAKETGQLFEDPYFPANSSSFGTLQILQNENPDNVKWLRPAEIAKLAKIDPLFHGPFNEFAVHQGATGDCWFLAVMAEVATKPDCINTLVPENNSVVGFEAGAVHFRFWSRGKWVDVTIDDRLACVVRGDDDYYVVICRPTKEGGFWAPLLEKAYAKLYGNYSLIDGGSSADAMQDFTGGIAHEYLNNDASIKGVIEDGAKHDAIMTFATKMQDKLSPELLNPVDPDPDNPGVYTTTTGLVLGHAYSLMEVRDVADKDDPSVVYTLIRARNPWGNDTEWNGDWSDTDPNNMWSKVEEDLRRKSADRKSDGEFWMSFDDFLFYVDPVDICRWSGKYRGNKDMTFPGGVLFIDYGNFPEGNFGTADTVSNKVGYYLHLKPIDPDAGELKNGLRYSCGLSVDLMWLNYKKTDDSYPNHGVAYFWYDGYKVPDEDYNAVVTGDNCFVMDSWRNANGQLNFPAGTLLVLPWLDNSPAEDTPYMIRLVVEGQVFKFNQ